jgi:hypothetical protein
MPICNKFIDAGYLARVISDDRLLSRCLEKHALSRCERHPVQDEDVRVSLKRQLEARAFMRQHSAFFGIMRRMSIQRSTGYETRYG